MGRFLAVVIDSNQDRKIHISMQLSAVRHEYLSCSSLSAIEESIYEQSQPCVFFVGADKGFSQLETALAHAKQSAHKIVTVLVGASKESLPREYKKSVFLCIENNCGAQELKSVIDLAAAELMQKNKIVKEVKSPAPEWQIEGNTPQICEVKDLILKVASADVSVLVNGESGTGKELAARAIHDFSNRRNEPFIPVNCGAIPSELIESELFGHEKGAFTGAIANRIGRFEQAHGGTLFLDEIGDMPANMQVKLLRVLQEKCFEKIGSNKVTKVNVRVIAATHHDLEALVAAGKFREDLYYRINVFPICMPALRERSGDIPTIAQAHADKLAQEAGNTIHLTNKCMAALSTYDWPGNVRELGNLISRLAVLYPNQEVCLPELPSKYRPDNFESMSQSISQLGCRQEIQTMLTAPELFNAPIDLKAHIQDMERNFLYAALSQSNGVVAGAAKLLGMQRTTLVEKMRKFDIERPKNTAEQRPRLVAGN